MCNNLWVLHSRERSKMKKANNCQTSRSKSPHSLSAASLPACENTVCVCVCVGVMEPRLCATSLVRACCRDFRGPSLTRRVFRTSCHFWKFVGENWETVDFVHESTLETVNTVSVKLKNICTFLKNLWWVPMKRFPQDSNKMLCLTLKLYEKHTKQELLFVAHEASVSLLITLWSQTETQSKRKPQTDVWQNWRLCLWKQITLKVTWESFYICDVL